jgi:hypothetical protein
MSKLDTILSLIKPTNKTQKLFNNYLVNSIFLINEKIKFSEDFPLWYLNCKKGLGFTSDLLFGRFNSLQITEFYQKGLINENSELRMILIFNT